MSTTTEALGLLDLAELEYVAKKSDAIYTDLYGDRYMQGSWSRVDLSKEQDNFIAAFTPEVVLKLIALACRAAEAPAAEAASIDTPASPAVPADPMDWPLPCDVAVGAGTIKAGCKLRTLVSRMTMLHEAAMRVRPMPAVPSPAPVAPSAYSYRKRPVVIEAFKFQRRNNGMIPCPDWYDDAVTRNDIITQNTGKWNDPTTPAYCEIKTLEGVMRADEGDWIIRGVKGELYPCKPDVFALTYEPAAASPLVDEAQLIVAGKVEAPPALNSACRCQSCNPQMVGQMMFLCANCGNKRCPHANDHRNACTQSNEPRQQGSAYPAQGAAE